MKKKVLIISCEHAVNTIPAALDVFFTDQEPLNSHRGIDFGALEIASNLSKVFKADFFQTSVSRLVIDCNRSLHSKVLFSEFTKVLTKGEKQNLIQEYYLPYRTTVIEKIREYVEKDFLVIHLSQHSFTPILNTIERNADLGLLYDPRRKGEQNFARVWRQTIRNLNPHLRIRMNYPYLGINDGFVTSLRKEFSAESYLGLEIEVNQALVSDRQSTAAITVILAQSLKTLIPI